MLYVSTRDHTNTYTAHRALFEQFTSDGGMFMPFKLPEFTAQELRQMKKESFGKNVAQILNLFFSARLTGWDVDFCCGRCPLDIITLPHKLLIAELWHNTASDYAFIERALYDKLCNGDAPNEISRWAKIAIRIAVFFAVYAVVSTDCGVEEVDVAVDDADFIAPLAAWYARRMGLPIGNIICGSNSNGSVWDLLHRGELSTASCSQNVGLEQLICATLGRQETSRFVSACQSRKNYHINEEDLAALSDRMFVAVTSAERISGVISSFDRSNGYKLDPSAAVSFGALQDFRSRAGESRTTLLCSLLNMQQDANLAKGKRG